MDSSTVLIAARLESINQNTEHVSVSFKRLEGSGSWLFEHPEYQAWSTGKNSVLLLEGLRKFQPFEV